jgi:ABC-type siderophore export system fused ATPase/permease subunit
MTLTQVVLFVSNNDTTGIVLMCIIGFLTTFFSKNMIVILCVALTMTNLVKKGMKQVGYEGFEDKKEEENKETEENTTKKEKKESTKVDDEVDDAPNSNESSSQTKDEMKREFERLKEEYPEFSALKEDIVDAMVKIDPILDKAETFMNKYSKYKSQKK